MATITRIFDEDFGYVRFVSANRLTTHVGGGTMEAHDDVGDYTTEGVLTVGNGITITTDGVTGHRLHTITIDPDLPDSSDTNYYADFYRELPVKGQATKKEQFRLGSSGVVDPTGWAVGVEGGGGGSVTISPIAATLSEFNIPVVNLAFAQREDRTYSVTFTDEAGDPVSFEGDTITAVVHTIRGTTALSEIACTVATTNYNMITIPAATTNTATAGTFKYDIWNESEDTRIAYGAFLVRPAVSY